jgi:hypothetical protein
MAPAAETTGGSDRPEFRVDGRSRTRRLRFSQAIQHGQRLKALALAQPVGPRGIVGHRFAHDLALRGIRDSSLGDLDWILEERDATIR